ncbi:FtsB family cell division protein [Candidatus Bipolaricaulota sp. J31]
MARGAALALVILAIAGGLLWLYLDKVFAIRDLNARIAALDMRRAELLARAEELSYLLSRADDRDMVELQIREKLLYGYPGEVLVLFGE